MNELLYIVAASVNIAAVFWLKLQVQKVRPDLFVGWTWLVSPRHAAQYPMFKMFFSVEDASAPPPETEGYAFGVLEWLIRGEFRRAEYSTSLRIKSLVVLLIVIVNTVVASHVI